MLTWRHSHHRLLERGRGREEGREGGREGGEGGGREAGREGGRERGSEGKRGEGEGAFLEQSVSKSCACER